MYLFSGQHTRPSLLVVYLAFFFVVLFKNPANKEPLVLCCFLFPSKLARNTVIIASDSVTAMDVELVFSTNTEGMPSFLLMLMRVQLNK